MMRSLSLLMIFLMSLAATCNKDTDTAVADRESTQPKENLEMEKGEYSYKILSELNTAENNVIISPASIRYILYMAAASTAGETQHEIATFLGMQPSELKKIRVEIRDEISAMNKSDSTFRSTFKNALFYDKRRVEIKDGYLDSLKNTYKAEITSLDFREDEETIKEINKWASEATENRIDKILDEINDDEFMFLLNALYIKADWLKAFNKEQTVKGTFFQSDEKKFSTFFMEKTEIMEAYISEDLKIAQLPLSNERITATFIMPLNESIDSFSEKLTPQMIREYEDLLSPQNINLKLPKMKMRYHVVLNETLKKLGLKNIFKAKSDFSPMTPSSEKVYMSRLLHDTYFEMDEKGIEGAAVTTAGMGVTSLPERIFFDHPFIISIKLNETGTQLFLGSITNPNPEK